MKKDLSINDFMEDCRIKIWNASGDDVIKTRLEPFGYTPEKWEKGKTLFNTTQSLIAGNEKEHGEWKTSGTLFLNAQALSLERIYNDQAIQLRILVSCRNRRKRTCWIYTRTISVNTPISNKQPSLSIQSCSVTKRFLSNWRRLVILPDRFTTGGI